MIKFVYKLISKLNLSKAYYEVCLLTQPGSEVYDNNLKVPSALVSSERVFFDNQRSITEKV